MERNIIKKEKAKQNNINTAQKNRVRADRQ